MTDSRLVRFAVAALVFAIALGVYVKTLTPTVGLVDSGELTVAAWSRGNAHPPGFPLYVMLTHFFTKLPWQTVAWRANLASAFFAALACGAIVFALDRRHLLPAALAGLLLAFSRTLWSYATVAEVYALNSFLLVTVIALMLTWRRTKNIRFLYVAALVFGLALGVHHVTTGLTLVALAVLVYREAGVGFFRSKHFAIAAACAIVGLLVYAHLPLAAARNPVMNWGDPDDAAKVVAHVTGKQYRSYVGAASDGSQFGDFLRYVFRDLGPIWLPAALVLAIYGFAKLFRGDRTLFWFLLLIMLANLAWVLVYPILNDRDAYLLPTFVALVLGAAHGAASVRKPAIAYALLLIPLLSLVAAYPYRDRSRFLVPKDYVDNALRTMERDAILLTSDWQIYAPLFYFLEAENVRPDVKVIETGLMIRSWYMDALEHRYPELMATVRNEVNAYRPLLDEWERTGVTPPEFNTRLDDLLVALVTRQVARGGHAYATIDVAMSQQAVDANMVRRLNADFDVVPRGIVLEYMRGHQLRELRPVPLETRGLLDGTTRYEADDVVVTEILPVYRAAFLMRGRYLAALKRFEESEAAYRQALAFAPNDMMIAAELRQVMATPR